MNISKITTNKIKNFYRRNTLLIKILLSYFMLGVIILLTFSYILNLTFSKKALEEVNRNSENMIYQSYYTADILLSNIYYNFYQLAMNNADEDITRALYSMDKLDQFAINNVITKLNQWLIANPLIRSIYIYNFKANRVIYKIPFGASSYQTIDEFFDKDIINMLRQEKICKNGIFFARNVNYTLNKYTINEMNISENLITLIFAYKSNDDKTTESALVVNLNQSIFQQMVTNGKVGDLHQVFMIYQNGDVLTHPDISMLNQNLSNESYIKKILQSKEKTGYFTGKVNGKDSVITFVKANRLGWILVGIGEYSKFSVAAKEMQKIISVLTIIFVLMGLIVAAFFASSIYTPFHKLLKDIQKSYSKQKKNQDLDVYDYLKYTFDELLQDVNKYRLDSYQLLNEKKKIILQKIINGEMQCNEDNINYIEECDIIFDSSFFIVVVLKIDQFAQMITKYWSNNETKFKFTVLNIACEMLGCEFKVEGIDNGTDYISIIINVKDDNIEWVDLIANRLKDIQRDIEKYIKCTVTASIGNVVEGIDNINRSFKNAMEASNYRIVYGKSSIIKYNDIAGRKAEQHEYPYDIEKQILDALKKFNKNKLEIGFNDFFDTIATFNVDEILMSIAQLLMVIAKTLTVMEIDEENNRYSFKVLYSEINTYETLCEMREYLLSLCYNAIELISSESETNKRIKVVNEIKNYIEQHYNDPNLSTCVISEHVKLSQNYVRSIFKEIIGISISDYITQYRMLHAQQMIKETNYSIKKIAELLGFSNYKYFYVIFKKYFGKTPDSYRKEVKV